MPKVDLKLYSTDAGDGKKITTSVTYINPNASNAVLKEFAQKLNAFTTNTYGAADRIETVNVDTDESRKQFRNISITGTSPNSVATITFSKTSTETVAPAVFFYTASNTQYLTAQESTSPDQTTAKYTVQLPNSSGTLYVGISEKDDFYSTFARQVIA